MSEALLLVGGERSPEVRHELAVGPPDPVIWLERDGEATVWTSPLDVVLIGDAGGVADVRSLDDLGFSALRPRLAQPDLFAELTRRALDGVTRVRVPWDFPVRVADGLREAAVDGVADPYAFAARRRAKREWELEGMRAAGRAAQAALLEAARLLRS
jgi:Xaa-Pro aminopeptidase